MEEEKAAAYYDELIRKGEGAARFKQGLGFSSSSNDAVPSRGSALVSSSSFLTSFVRASSPSKTSEFEKQAQLQTIQNKLKKKPKDDRNSLSSRVSKGKTSRSPSLSREKHSIRRSPSLSREKHSIRRSPSPRQNSKRRSRSRSRSRSRDRSKRPYRSRSRIIDKDKLRERERKKEKQSRRSMSPRDRRSDKDGKDRAATVDYIKLIQGYENMTLAGRVRAKMKLQLSESARKDERKGMDSGWERFYFDKDAPLDDEEIEAVEDNGALVNHIGKSFRFSAVEVRPTFSLCHVFITTLEEQIKAAHDEAIFGAPSLLPLPPSTETDDEAEEDNGKKDLSKVAPATSLISGHALAMQQGSWRDRARRS
ncbi:hypothetical protein RND71_026503 [Anisodus tanguticus]|uniref:Uncharacterized protein n=1 Tax=Anisodus tanguticus TaxID=243964 RepID=A0AAE1VAK1_9SOLA|nr:hypothetical protein RND71_026503 [Anisodus tanguticus]